MRTKCQRCSSPITVKEAIHRICTRCRLGNRRQSTPSTTDTTTIKQNFDDLVRKELEKLKLVPAA